MVDRDKDTERKRIMYAWEYKHTYKDRETRQQLRVASCIIVNGIIIQFDPVALHYIIPN